MRTLTPPSAGGIAIGQGAAAETPGEVQIGVKTGAEAPTALRVGADRVITRSELVAAVTGAADFAALKAAIAALDA